MLIKPRFTVCIVVYIALVASMSLLAQPQKISALKLRIWLDAENPPLVLDVRGRDIYPSGSVPGAVNVGRDPLGYLPDVSKSPVVLLAPVDVDEEFIQAWQRRLADAGHAVWVLDSGLEGWKAAGGAVESHDVTYTKPGRVPFVIPRGLCEGNYPAQIFK